MPKSHEVPPTKGKKESSKCLTLPHLEDKKLGKKTQFFTTKNYAREDYEIKRWNNEKAKGKRMRIENQCGMFLRRAIETLLSSNARNMLHQHSHDISDDHVRCTSHNNNGECGVIRWNVEPLCRKRNSMKIEHQCGMFLKRMLTTFCHRDKIPKEVEIQDENSSLNYSSSSLPSDEGDYYFSKQYGLNLESAFRWENALSILNEEENLPYNLQNHIENILLLMSTLASVTTWHGICSAILLYIKSYVSDSVALQVLNFVYDGLNFSQYKGNLRVETQAGIFSSTNDVKMHSECMHNIQKGWDKVKNSPFFPAVSRLLGLLVTLNLYKLSDLTFTLGEHKIFEPDMRGLHNRADNIIDAILNTIVYFSENIVECISKRSIKPFFLSETVAESLDEKISRVISWWPLVRQGNFSVQVKEDESVFRKELEDIIASVRQIINKKQGSAFELKLLRDKFEELLRIHHDYLTYKTGGVLRRAPFALELFGASSQGKTVCGEQLICALLSSANIDTNKDRHTVFNAGDKYESNHKTDTTVIIMDDIANAKKDSIDYSPAQKIIEYVNNQPLYAVKAELADKGKCWIEPHILLATTNVKDLDAFSYSNCPYSVQRRMNYILRNIENQK
jgi:hypothetical protein